MSISTFFILLTIFYVYVNILLEGNYMKKVNIEVPGLRILKTVVTVLIVVLLSHFSHGILRAYEMAIVAVLAIQSDVSESFNEVRNRLSSTLIGGIIGTIAMCIMFAIDLDIIDALVASAGVFIILYFCSKIIGKAEYILIACYVFLAIVLDQPATISWIYPLRIMLNTIVASIVAMIVNLYNPKYLFRRRIKLRK